MNGQRSQFMLFATGVRLGECVRLTHVATRRGLLQLCVVTPGFEVVGATVNGQAEGNHQLVGLAPGDELALTLECMGAAARRWDQWSPWRFWRVPPVTADVHVLYQVTFGEMVP